MDDALAQERAKPANIQALQDRLRRLNIGLEKNEEGKLETVFHQKYQPVKHVRVEDRAAFKKMSEEKIKASGLAYNPENIKKLFPAVKETDFKNTGKLLYPADFAIFLNNILLRTGLTPVTPEHFDHFISDFESGEL